MNENKFSSQKLVLGLVLLAFGVLAFVDSIDLWYPGSWWRLWPLVLIVLGLSSEIDTFRERRAGGGGSILIAIGVWFLAAMHNVLGLTHRTAFPVAIAIVGLFMAIHAVVDRPEQKKENTNEPC